MSSENTYIYGSSNAARIEGIIPNPHRRMTIDDNINMPDSIWDVDSGRLVLPKDEEIYIRRHQGKHQRRRRRHPYAQSSTVSFKRQEEKDTRPWKWASQGLMGKRLNLSTAMVFAMALFVLLGMFTLSHRSSLEDWNDKYEITMRGISQVREENREIQARIDDAKRDGDIAYRAANELGMIRASDAHTIPLLAVDAYPQEAVQTGYTAEVVVDGWGDEEPTQMTTAVASAE